MDAAATDTEADGGLNEAIDRRAFSAAELRDANAAVSGGGCCLCGLLELSDIADFEYRARAQESKPSRAPPFFFPFFLFRKK